MLKMIFKDLRISPLRNILTSISMLVGIIAMIGSFLVGTLGKDYLISVNAQMYGWTPTYSYSITDSDFQDSIKMEEFFYKIREIDDCVTITFDMRENIIFAPIVSVSSLQGAANDIYKKVVPVDVVLTTTAYNKIYNLPMSSGSWFSYSETEKSLCMVVNKEAESYFNKADKFIGSFYDSNEVQALFEAAKGTLIEIPIFLGAFYGLRRSEALGLKWDAIDFQNNTITIRHTVTSCNLDGKHIQIAQDTTKTKSSMRTLPLVPVFKEKLLKLKEQQEEYKRVCGRCYNKKYLEYICVDEMGTLISPHYLTASFPKLLEKNNLRHIRFHDLRHSCASLLLANGVPMKQIQEWLGHSDFSTTANVYAHLDYNSKLSSADAMVNGLSGALEVIS